MEKEMKKENMKKIWKKSCSGKRRSKMSFSFCSRFVEILCNIWAREKKNCRCNNKSRERI